MKYLCPRDFRRGEMEENMCETVFSNFLGAFFGFLFAILVEVMVSRYNDKDMQKKVKNSLKEELLEIQQSLSEIENSGKNPSYFRYQFVAWKTCVNSGYLFSVSGKTLYNLFVKIYTDIEFADNLEQRYFELFVIRENNDTKAIKQVLTILDNERKIRRTKLLQELDKILKV